METIKVREVASRGILDCSFCVVHGASCGTINSPPTCFGKRRTTVQGLVFAGFVFSHLVENYQK